MFSMNKYLGEHLSSLEDWKDPERKDDDGLEDEEAKRVKEEDSGEEEDNAGRKQKRKRATRKAANTSGIWKRYKLSDQLGAIVGENISNRQQVSK
jgi:chromatin remodeling complex protein RSC6